MTERLTAFAGQAVPAIKGMHESIGVNFAIIEKRKKGEKIEHYCKSNGIDVLFVESRKDLEDLSKLYNFDIVLSCGFGIIFPSPFIDSCKYIVNIHPGDIYKYRGRHPLPWAIINGEEMCSITAHLITSEKIDDGPIIFMAKFPIEYNFDYHFNASRIDYYSGEIAREICSCYKEFKFIPSSDFTPPEGSYLPPLDKKTLMEIMGKKNLKSYKRDRS